MNKDRKLPFYQRWANKLFSIVRKSQIRMFLDSLSFRKSANFFACSPQIANPQIYIINPQIANSQTSIIYCTTLSQNSPKSRLFIMIFSNLCVCGLAEFKDRKSQKGLGPQIAKSAKGHICGSIKLFLFKLADLRKLFAVRPPFAFY
jgi:hypothetical protein